MSGPDDDILSVLDVGCGNGRFAQYLLQQWGSPVRYLGLDSSPDLLDVARASLGGGGERQRAAIRFRHLDVVTEGICKRLPGGPFHLVALFGVLHHLPSLKRRRSLLAELAGQLQPCGLMALTFWQFGALDRFRRRVIAWEQHNREVGDDEQIDLGELEAGDLLLAWGELSPAADGSAPTPRRYCHFADAEETEQLVDSSGLEVVDSFLADGRSHDLNLYYIAMPVHGQRHRSAQRPDDGNQQQQDDQGDERHR